VITFETGVQVLNAPPLSIDDLLTVDGNPYTFNFDLFTRSTYNPYTGAVNDDGDNGTVNPIGQVGSVIIPGVATTNVLTSVTGVLVTVVGDGTTRFATEASNDGSVAVTEGQYIVVGHKVSTPSSLLAAVYVKVASNVSACVEYA
jgi:hypothetical protein